MRYVQLHRELERGLAGSERYLALARVCVELDKIGEAAKLLRDVECEETCHEIRKLLASRGVIAHEVSAVRRAVRPAMDGGPGTHAARTPSHPAGQQGGLDRQPIAAAANEDAGESYVRKPLPPVAGHPTTPGASAAAGVVGRPDGPPPSAGVDPMALASGQVTDPALRETGRPAPRALSAPSEGYASLDAGADAARPKAAALALAKATPQIQEVEEEGLVAEVQDAGLFLLQDHMPVLILVLTLAFPLAATTGLFLPESFGMVASVVQVLAPLAVLALFLHIASNVLRGAIEGDEEPAPLSELFQGLPMGAVRSFVAVTVLGAVGFGPAVLAYVAGLASAEAAVLGLFGFAYIPLALLGLCMRGKVEAAMPGAVLRAVLVARGPYLRLTFLCSLILLLPCLAIAIGAGSAMILQSALAGPLFVVPGFLLARCIGRYGYEHREALQRAFGVVVEQVMHDPRAHARSLARRRVQTVTQSSHPRRQPAPHMPRTVEHSARTITENREIEVNEPSPRRSRQRALGAYEQAAEQAQAQPPRAPQLRQAPQAPQLAHAATAAQRAEEAKLDALAAEQVRQHYAQVEAQAMGTQAAAAPRGQSPQAPRPADPRPAAPRAAAPRHEDLAAPKPGLSKRPVAREVRKLPDSRPQRRSSMPEPAPRSGVYPTQVHVPGSPESRKQKRPASQPRAVPPAQRRGPDPRRSHPGSSGPSRR